MDVFKDRQARYTFWTATISLAAILSLATYLTWPYLSMLNQPQTVRTVVASYGPFAPAVFITLQTLQIIIAPIPGQVTGIASGYLFGAINGTIYTMIGTIIGSAIAFGLSRWLGRSFVERVVDNSVIERFDDRVEHEGEYLIFLIFLLPGFPDDAICFMAGLTVIPIRRLVLLAFLGRLPGFLVLNMVGAGIAEGRWMLSLIIAVIGFLATGIVYWYRRRRTQLG